MRGKKSVENVLNPPDLSVVQADLYAVGMAVAAGQDIFHHASREATAALIFFKNDFYLNARF